MGDLNVHHAKWLRFSNGNSIVGADLKAFSENYGLHQLVKEPTRNEYLLDLLLTDIAGAKVKVGSYVADHKYLLAQIPAPEISQTMIKRKEFKLAQARWKDLKKDLENVNWSILKEGTAEDAVNQFLSTLWLLLCKHIPFSEFSEGKRSHPWLNERCEKAWLVGW